jgi:acetylornithine deacetylase/succinyl-diaminopimelate desuccinylase-like protein
LSDRGARVVARLEELFALGRPPHADGGPMWTSQRVAFDARVLGALGEAADLPRLQSWGGHDAGVLAQAGVPAAMLFVRSLAGGVSHHPDEHTCGEDIDAAVAVLAAGLRHLAR